MAWQKGLPGALGIRGARFPFRGVRFLQSRGRGPENLDMHASLPRLALVLAALTLPAFAQGPLVPAAGPAPSMKSLAQVEPRTPISPTAGFPLTLNQPGSYYLTGNINVSGGNVIVIAADDITLDLNGFAISSTAPFASGSAITLAGGRSRVAISNGLVRSGVTYVIGSFTAGPGFVHGLSWSGAAPNSVRVSQLSVCGVQANGIDLGTDASTIAQACTVRVAGGLGLRAGVVSDSSATIIGATSVSAGRIANTVGALANGSGSGFSVSGPTLDSLSARADARIPLPPRTSTVYINSPGSYYLTGDIVVSTGDAIVVAASGVTLDLNGYALVSTASPAGGAGIFNDGVVNGLIIRNGHIRSTATAGPGNSVTYAGFSSGVLLGSTTGALVSDLTVSGIDGTGIQVSGNSVVRSCTVDRCSSIGISAYVVQNCCVTRVDYIGIQAAVTVGSFADGGAGISSRVVALSAAESKSQTAITGSVVANSSAFTLAANGIEGRVVIGSLADCNGGSGDAIKSTNGVVLNSFGSASSGAGLRAFTANGSRGESISGPAQVITNRYNMP